MSDAWVWDMYRPARFVKNVRVLTFKDVNVEELARHELSVELPGTSRALVHSDGRLGWPSTACLRGRPHAGGRGTRLGSPDRARSEVAGAGQGRVGCVRRAGGGRAPGGRGDDRPGPQLALPAGRDRHRRARRRRAGRLRGEDPVVAPRSGTRWRPSPRARRRGCAGWPRPGSHERRVHPAEVRIDLVGVLRPARGAAGVEHVRGVA